MGAPTETSWGSIAGSYCRIGIYKSKTETNTKISYAIQVWFWSKYSVADAFNSLYFDVNNDGESPTTFVKSPEILTEWDSGDGWHANNQIKIYETTVEFTRTTSNQTRYAVALLKNVDKAKGAMEWAVPLDIPAIPKYTITFDANGGTGAPASISQFKNANATIPTTKPTRTGYTFEGWGTPATATTATYQPGDAITTRTDTKLYALWTALTYSVEFDANGGDGAPTAQTKTHGTALKLSTTVPTKSGYTFKGWGLSATSTTATYQPGGSYTNNSAATLYAVWELAYKIPIIYNLTANRCDSSKTLKEDGTYALVSFNWECFFDVTEIIVAWSSPSSVKTESSLEANGKSGLKNVSIGGGLLDVEKTYSITVTVTDSGGSTSSSITLPGSIFPMDVLNGGKGISFGKNAELENTAEFAFDAKFNKPVYGKALGMDRLPAIPANSDFNDYMETGCYAVQSNAISETCKNIPVKRAGRLEVWASTGEGVRLAQWSYLRQRFIPYNSPNAVYERELTRGEDNTWTYYDWWRSSLTPNASEKVYSKAAITIALGAASAMTSKNTYTQIPLNQSVVSTGSRLTLDSNSIKIGKNIEYVKVSGQALMQCGSTAGNRHVRIQKVRNGTTTGVAWTFVSGTQGEDTHLTLPPVIVAVQENDILKMVYYTSDTTDQLSSGSILNGWQTYMTVEEI